jgi:cytochrome c-type biogenesis protein CcmH/NrfG
VRISAERKALAWSRVFPAVILRLLLLAIASAAEADYAIESLHLPQHRRRLRARRREGDEGPVSPQPARTARTPQSLTKRPTSGRRMSTARKATPQHAAPAAVSLVRGEGARVPDPESRIPLSGAFRPRFQAH